MMDDDRRRLPDELKAWLDRDDLHEKEEIEHVWMLLGEHYPGTESVPDRETALQALNHRLAARPDIDSVDPSRRNGRLPRRPRRASRLRTGWITAAVVIVVLVVSMLYWRIPVEVSTLPGERTVHTLPDGSTVELTGGTTLTYQRNFQRLPLISASERATRVHGEALFEVVSDGRPFLVETFNAEIEVIGTRFDVQAWSSAPSPQTEVTLDEGQVRLSAKGSPEEPVTLSERGQRSRVVGITAPTPPERVAVDHADVWRQQGFFAAEQSLSLILQRLEQRFGVMLTLEAPTVQDDAMTLYYTRNADLETILRDISRAKDLKYRATSRGYELLRDPDVVQ